MVCRFILGRAGAGKTDYCLQEMARLLQARQVEPPVLFILPEQATFLHERMLASQYLPHGYLGGEVTSFRRLIWRANQRAGKRQLLPLSEAARTLLMGKLLAEQREELQVFGAASLGSGFAGELVAAAEELMVYGVQPATLRQAAGRRATGQAAPALARKLADISLLYDKYTAEIDGLYENFADGMAFLVKEILENEFLAGATVFVDGYSEFTPCELQVLEALMHKTERLEIALPLDPLDLQRTLAPEDIFYPAWRCYGRLAEAAQRARVKVAPPLRLIGREGRFQNNPELAFLEQHCYPYHDPAIWQAAPQKLQINAAPDKRTELETVGREILRLTREQGLRFREISVIARDSAPYEALLPTVFDELGIPYFVDAQKSLLYHPLVELLRSALEIWAGEPHYRPVFRYLKTGLAPLTRAETDRLENYCLAHGIRHWQWRADEDWQWWRGLDTPEDAARKLAAINETRRRGMAALRVFWAEAPPSGPKVEAAALLQAMKRLLESLNVTETLTAWQEAALAQGDGATAALHRQAAEKVQNFLDEALLLLGASVLSAEQILSLVDAGCASLTVSMIPPGLDQVLVASLDRSRNPELKAAFVIGLNADMLPQKIQPDALFSDFDRAELAKDGIELAPDSLSRQMAEHYLAYVALTRSGERLYLSYALNADDGKALLPSPLIRRVRTVFPQAAVHYYGEDENPANLAGGALTLAQLAHKLAESKGGQPLAGYWRDVYNWYASEESWRASFTRLAQGFHYAPQKKPLQSATLARLYGNVMRSSVSRLEQFRSCPFSYFASYGLRLKNRPVYQITPLERGDIFHQALAMIGQRVGAEGGYWADIGEAEAQSLVTEALEVLLPEYLAGILTSTARYRYLAERIKNTLISTVLLMAEHMRRGHFVPVAWELPFGDRKDDCLPSYSVDLGNGKRLSINGQIDRVDIAQGEHCTYFRIVDYKTGNASVSIEDIFRGMQLQLLVYLQVVLDNHLYFAPGAAEPAGMYYLGVRDHVLSGEMPAEDEEAEPVGLKLSGLTVQNEEAVRLADPDVNGHSKLIPVALSAKGFFANSPGVSEERFGLLRNHLMTTLRATASQLLAGLVDVAPRRDKSFDACAYCDYRRFCGFDRTLAEPQAGKHYAKAAIWQMLEGGEIRGL